MGVSTTTYAGDLAVIGAGAAGLLNPRIDLMVSISPNPSKTTAWADLTVPTYTGYAGPITPVISAPYISNTSKLVTIDLSDQVFNGPTSGAGADVVGWVLHDTSTPPVVYAAGLFDGPLKLQIPTDRVTIDETIGLALTPTYEVQT